MAGPASCQPARRKFRTSRAARASSDTPEITDATTSSHTSKPTAAATGPGEGEADRAGHERADGVEGVDPGEFLLRHVVLEGSGVSTMRKAPVRRSRTKTWEPVPLMSSNPRSVADEVKAAQRPSALSDGASDVPSAPWVSRTVCGDLGFFPC